MDEEAVFQTAFFLKEFLYTEKKTLEFSENTKVFLENSKVFSEKMKEFFLGLFLMISKIHILRFTPSYCNTDYYLPDKCETYFLITSQ